MKEAQVGGFTVAGQPSADELTSGRFGTIVNIRGNDEPGNISAEALRGSDVAYTGVPWTIDTVTVEDIHRIRDAVAGADGPVLIH